jgi:ubiquinone/menaquinone biosynthesis C-methylase UbiE
MSLGSQYDFWHRRVHQSDPGHADESSPWYRLVLEYLEPVEGKRILEIACGRGGFSRLLAGRGARVTGSDFSHAALTIAGGKAEDISSDTQSPHFVQADAHQLPYRDGTFDIIISCETIEHLLNPAAALGEMARVCRSGGTLYLTTPNYLNATGLYILYALMRRNSDATNSSPPPSGQPLDRRYFFFQVRKMLAYAGWTILRADGTVHQFPVIPRHDPLQAPALESWPFLRHLLCPFAFHYFLLARRGPAIT